MEEEVNQVYSVRYHEYKALCSSCCGLVFAELCRSEEISCCCGVKHILNHLYYKVRCSYPECIRFKHLGSEPNNNPGCLKK